VHGTGDRGQGTDTPRTTHHSSLTSSTEVNVAGRDLRIRPDTGELDATSGNTQFGRERDDWGNWFGGNNSNPMWHYVLDDHYLRRNPHFAPPAVRKSVSSTPGTAPVFPKSQTLARFNDFSMANRFTSACSPIIYRDDLLGSEYYGNSFVCEPVHNLVHREVLQPQGATFTSKRAADEQTSEFLASEDSWFRPSMCRTGPDGALWVADMYRFVIEHPKWVPPAAQARLELRAGDDKGRIYRIYPEGKQPRPIRRLDQLDTAGLVAALDSPNGHERDLAHQMLLWNADQAAMEPLTKLAATSQRPQSRLQALCAAAGLREQGSEPKKPEADRQWRELLRKAMRDEHLAIRQHAIRLAESELNQSLGLARSVLDCGKDADLHVRMQAAYALGFASDYAATQALAEILSADPIDPYLAAAAMSSVTHDNVGSIMHLVLTNPSARQKFDLLERLMASAVGYGNDKAVRDALANPLSDSRIEPWHFHVLASFADAIERKGKSFAEFIRAVSVQRYDRILAEARRLAPAGGEEAIRLAAIRLLGRGLDRQEEDVEMLAQLLAPQQPVAVQSSAAAALTRPNAPIRLSVCSPAGHPTLRRSATKSSIALPPAKIGRSPCSAPSKTGKFLPHSSTPAAASNWPTIAAGPSANEPKRSWPPRLIPTARSSSKATSFL
jgi:hypothetical protein